jgi:hypothetical protein
MFWKMREIFPARKPGASGGRQAARKAGPIIRIAIAKGARIVMGR